MSRVVSYSRNPRHWLGFEQQSLDVNLGVAGVKYKFEVRKNSKQSPGQDYSGDEMDTRRHCLVYSNLARFLGLILESPL